MSDVGKITEAHRRRRAVVYVRHRAARRLVVSPAQPGGTRREVLGSNGLPGSER